MKLLAGSIEVESNTYLHAGYLSAYPRSFGEGGFLRFWHHETTTVINIPEAVALREPADESQPAATISAARVNQALTPATMVSELFALTVAFLFFAWLIGVYYQRVRKTAHPAWRPWVLAGVSVFVFAFFPYWALPAMRVQRLNALPPPWEDVPVQPYQNPELATQAIMQALIVNALAGSPQGIASLAAIQEEVAFPVPAEDYTPGMEYARRTYGRDGWGRDFAFELLGEGKYRVSSAGHDGALGTPDDIVVDAGVNERGWEYALSGIFARWHDQELVCFIHQVDDPLFRKARSAESGELTSTSVFDMFTLKSATRDPKDAPNVLQQLREQMSREAQAGRAVPLYFVQFIRAERE